MLQEYRSLYTFEEKRILYMSPESYLLDASIRSSLLMLKTNI